MKQPQRVISRQLALSLECETTIILAQNRREEVISALADLLLGALGEAAVEVENESKD